MMMSMRILNQRAIVNGIANTLFQQPRLQKTVVTAVATTRLQQYTARCNYMSTQPCSAPEEDAVQMMLILGKPGGGKGTISEKLLKVSAVLHCNVFLIHIRNEFVLP